MEEFLKKYNTSEEGLSSNEVKKEEKCGYALFRTVH